MYFVAFCYIYGMDREKVIKNLIAHIDEEEQLENDINREKNPNKSYKLMRRLYRVKAIINKLYLLVNKIPHNKGEHEFDVSNPNYDKIDYDRRHRK